LRSQFAKILGVRCGGMLCGEPTTTKRGRPP
jgi:hypothetical protein